MQPFSSMLSIRAPMLPVYGANRPTAMLMASFPPGTFLTLRMHDDLRGIVAWMLRRQLADTLKPGELYGLCFRTLRSFGRRAGGVLSSHRRDPTCWWSCGDSQY